MSPPTKEDGRRDCDSQAAEWISADGAYVARFAPRFKFGAAVTNNNNDGVYAADIHTSFD